MNEQSIFASALAKKTADDRKAFLDEACGQDAALRAQVEELLAADAGAGSFLEHPPAGVDVTVDATLGSKDTVDAGVPSGALPFLEPCDKPDRIGKLGLYEIIEVVGQGGMGSVLRALDTKLSRIVAVKIMAPELAANPTAVKRFLREAQSAAAVVHDHVVHIYGVYDESRPPYLVMEFIQGQTLQQKIDREGTLELRHILRIGSQMAAGLAAAHKTGLIHRDVKPGNILLENGVERVKITDFGLARAADDVEMTKAGMIAGTPQYMSPEQANGGQIDFRSDLFSLGSVLYTMCTGRPAFRAETTMGTLRRVSDDAPRPIQEVNAEIPDWLEAIVMKLLAKKPEDRFQTAKEVEELLGQHLAHVQNPAQVPQPEPVRVPMALVERSRSPSRWKTMVWSALAIALIAVSARIDTAVLTTGVGLNPSFFLGNLVVLGLIGFCIYSAIRCRPAQSLRRHTGESAVTSKPDAIGWLRPALWGIVFLPVVCIPVYALIVQAGPAFGRNLPLALFSAGMLCVVALTIAELLARTLRNDRWRYLSRALVFSLGYLSIGLVVSGFLSLSKEAYVTVGANDDAVRVSFTNQETGVSYLLQATEDTPVPAGTYLVQASCGPEHAIDFVSVDEPAQNFVVVGSYVKQTYPKGQSKDGIHVKLGERERTTIMVRVGPRNDGTLVLPTDRPWPPTFAELAKVMSLPGSDGWIRLFNGSDLAGWKAIPPQHWRVENGVIHGSGPDAFLVSQTGDFDDFHLVAEYRINDKGDSGIHIRMPPPEERPGTRWGYSVTGMEAEVSVRKSASYRSGALTVKDPDVRVLAPSSVPPHAANEWERLEIIALKDHIQILLNGKLITDYTDPDRKFTRGHIALCSWEGNDIKTKVEFRKVEIRKLPAVQPEGSAQAIRLASLDPAKDKPISAEYTDAGANGWLFTTIDWKGFRLLELREPKLDNCRLIARLRMKSAEVREAYPRLVARFSGGTAKDTIGTPSLAARGDTNWTTYEVALDLKAGERPELVELGLHMEGKGTSDSDKQRKNQVWIKDVELLRAPLPAAAARTSVNDAGSSAEGWTPLLGEKDLTGWHAVGGTPATWKMENGILRGSGSPSYLVSDKSFSQFALKAEMRVNPGGEWGILFRTDPTGLKNKQPRGLGVSFTFKDSTNDVDGHMRMEVEPIKDGNSLARVIVNVKPNDWFPVKLTVREDQIDVQISGGGVGASKFGATIPTGPLILHLPNANSALEFRNIEIQELPPATKK